MALGGKVVLIQALIPLGLHTVEDALQQEVIAPAGPQYARGDGTPDTAVGRWLATALLDIEPRRRRLRGYRALLRLRAALQRQITQAKVGAVG